MKWSALLLVACTLTAGMAFPTEAATPEQPIAGIVHYEIYTSTDTTDIYFDSTYMAGHHPSLSRKQSARLHQTGRRWHHGLIPPLSANEQEIQNRYHIQDDFYLKYGFF